MDYSKRKLDFAHGKNKNMLRTFSAWNQWKFKNVEAEKKFRRSYKKKSVYILEQNNV